MKTPWSADNDRRLGFDRRQFSYDEHIPERRSGKERRLYFNDRQESSQSNKFLSVHKSPFIK
jgi:hypothetical protein